MNLRTFKVWPQHILSCAFLMLLLDRIICLALIYYFRRNWSESSNLQTRGEFVSNVTKTIVIGKHLSLSVLGVETNRCLDHSAEIPVSLCVVTRKELKGWISP